MARKELAIVGLAGLVDGADVRMVERRGGPRLLEKARLGDRIAGQLRERNLSATVRSRRVSSALYTTPMLPAAQVVC